MKLLLGFAIGMAFGAVLQLGGASKYHKIEGTLLLRDLTILKLILTAIGVGTIGIYALDAFSLAHLSIKPTYVAGVIVAGLLFGAGFALAGYCPGTALVAAAERKWDALFTVAGGLVGALLYALVHPALGRALELGSYGKPTVPDLLHVPALAIALPFGLVVLLAVWRWVPSQTRTREEQAR